MAQISLLTSRSAVTRALEEFDQKGRDAFLAEYGYRRSVIYELVENGKRYDSKAIVGVAYGYQHGDPLGPHDFSGGAKTVVRTLEKLGFTVQKGIDPLSALRIGMIYQRIELRERFGGQLQKGIWTPKEFSAVFLFSGLSGASYGYRDGWVDGVYRYSGEGQIGNMAFTSGNLAIRDHRAQGKDLLLFEDLGKGNGVQYKGVFACASWSTVKSHDKHKKPRTVIIFHLVPVEAAASPQFAEIDRDDVRAEKSLEDLRKAAYAAAKEGPTETTSKEGARIYRERSKDVRAYVLRRANGICEGCHGAAPFLAKTGWPYLEPHHTVRMADDGPDHPQHVAAICPNCHRRVHSGEDGPAWNEQLKAMLKKVEARWEDTSALD